MVLETGIFGSDAWSSETMRRDLVNEQCYYLVAVDDAEADPERRLDGYAGLLAPERRRPRADIQTIAVAACARRQRPRPGAHACAHRRGAEARRRASVFLEVRADNPDRPDALPRRSGSSEIGVRPRLLPARRRRCDSMRLGALAVAHAGDRSAVPRLRSARRRRMNGAARPRHRDLLRRDRLGLVRGRMLLRQRIVYSMARTPVRRRRARARGRAHLEDLGRRSAALAQAGVDRPRPTRATAARASPARSGRLGAAKALALALDGRSTRVNHLVGHMPSTCSTHGTVPRVPVVALVVSGGHTSLLLVRDRPSRAAGETMDDAAGEAFDKVARLLGLPYPGGPQIDRAARVGDPDGDPVPARTVPRNGHGEAPLRLLVLGPEDRGRPLGRAARGARRGLPMADVAASFREAVVDVLVARPSRRARPRRPAPAARRRGDREHAAARAGVDRTEPRRATVLRIPPLALCTDNGAMIAASVPGSTSMAGRRPSHPGLRRGLDPAGDSRSRRTELLPSRAGQRHLVRRGA